MNRVTNRMGRTAASIIAATILLAAGCMSLEQMAPPVEQLAAGPGAGAHPPDQLVRGRRIYLTQCAKCHNVEPISRYSLQAWQRDILPEMIDETNLTDAQAQDLRAYVLTAHQFLQTTAAAPGR